MEVKDHKTVMDILMGLTEIFEAAENTDELMVICTTHGYPKDRHLDHLGCPAGRPMDIHGIIVCYLGSSLC